MKRILLFIDSLGAGGAQRQLTGLAVLLQQHGYMVKVVTFYDYPFYKHVLDEHQCDYECMGMSSKYCLPKLVGCIRRFKPDVLISYQTVPNALACLAAAWTHTRLIVSERNTHLKWSCEDWIIYRLYRLACYIVPNSYSEGEFIGKHIPAYRSKTVTISNFVDLDLFRPLDTKQIHAVRQLLVVASVKASKNTQAFIRAFHRAKGMGCTLQVKWYGVNPPASDLPQNVAYAEECIRMIETLGLADSFALLPKCTDIQYVYQQADIFCLPSHFEGTPNVICEAMASALPVICSDVCDNGYFVKEGYNGMLFNQKDEEDMARVLCAVSAMSEADLQEWGKRSRCLAEEKCDKEQFVRKYIKLIES